ncbi:MAG: MFS transporter [Actinobacteria bacterium]|nr:MFS transporter [Actinomycetota bacterium]
MAERVELSAPASSGIRPRAGWRWFTLFGAAQLVTWIYVLTPTQFLMPTQLDTTSRGGAWTDGILGFGLVTMITGTIGLAAGPLVGALSDRTRSRWGRRKPWAIGGAVFAAIWTFLSGFQADPGPFIVLGLLGAFTTAGVSIFLVTAVADQLPPEQQGAASGIIGATQAAAIVIGGITVAALPLPVWGHYAVLALLILLILLPILILIPDPVGPVAVRERRRGLRALAQFWVSPRRHPNFALVFASRALVNLGNAMGTSVLLFFIIYGLGVGDARGQATDTLLLATVIYTVFCVIGSIAMGRISDRLGRRIPFVVAAALLQGVAAVLIGVMASVPVLLVSAALLGAAYGTFMSVDLALAIEVLPEPEHIAKDLALMNLAQAYPQVLAPIICALLALATGGFAMMFLVAGALSIIGAVMLRWLRGVR